MRSSEIIPAGGFGGGLNTAPPELTVASRGVAFAPTVPTRRLSRVARRKDPLSMRGGARLEPTAAWIVPVLARTRGAEARSGS